jgi:hypothetical protein
MDHDIVRDHGGLGLSFGLLATQYGFDACQQNAWAKRFGQLIIGTEFESGDDIRVFAASGQHHNRNSSRRWITPECLTDF